MSAPSSIFELTLENDENVRSWKNQVIETENLIKSMQNDLEVEQAKKNLLLTEMRGKILQVDQLTLRSSQQANERLQNLMVDQLVEINKSEILVKVNEENYKQCTSSLQEISRWESHVPEVVVIEPHVGREKESEIQLQDEEELNDDERKAIEEDISKIEEAIAESEKEHAVLKEFLTEHQRLLTEMESGSKVGMPEGRKRLSNNQENTTVQQGTVAPSLLQESSNHHWDRRIGAGTAAPSDINSAPICSMPRSKVPNRAFEAKHAIVSKKVGNAQNAIYHQKADSSEGFGINYRTSESAECTSITEPTPPIKQPKLNLYDTPGGATSLRPARKIPFSQSQASLTKTGTTFKPKIPSTLRNRIN